MRGAAIKERQAATEQYARMVQKQLENAGCFDGKVLDVERMKEVLESGRVEASMLTNLLTGQLREEE